MNKLLLLGALGILSVPATAQQLQKTKNRIDPTFNPNGAQLLAQRINKPLNGLAKAATTSFYTETFGSGTPTSLPTGWTAMGNSNFSATWHWTNRAATSQFNIGALASTTASDGWMIYDSDSIGTLSPTTTPIEGYLTSPSVNCSGHSSVVLEFEQYYRKFQDSCFVQVSTDNFISFTQFDVQPNNGLTTNDYTGANPTSTRVDITSAAANQANVKFRFYYKGTFAGGSYNWMIDDVKLSEADPIDVTIHNSSLIMRGPSGRYTLASAYPVSLVDTTWGITLSDNIGANPATTTYSYEVRRNGTSLPAPWGPRSITIPQSGIDSLIDFSEPYPGFYPNVVGSYQASFDAAVSGDATPANNVDTADMAITDSVLAVYNPNGSAGGYYLHRGVATGVTETKNFIGIQFTIAPGKSDTVTAMTAIFTSSTAPGGNVSIQIYERNGTTGYTPIATSMVMPLTSLMVSPAGGPYVTTTFPIDISNGLVILDSGSYVAVMQGESIPAANDVTILGTTPLNTKLTGFTGFAGALDDSRNDGALDFSPSSIAVGVNIAPVIRVIFGGPTAVKDVTASFEAEAARPNPANTQFTVPVTLKANAANVTVTLTNPMGQVVATQNLGKVAAGQTQNAVFNTSSLAAGVYFYTVEAAGERTTNRVVVAH